MFTLTRTQVQPIGLDLGHDSIKMLQLESAGGALRVRAAARQPLPESAKEQPLEARLADAARTMRQMFHQHAFGGRRVVVPLPREILHVKNLRLPMIPASEMSAALRYEGRTLFPFEMEEAVVQYLSAGEVRQGSDVRQEVIVLAARRADVDRFVEILSDSGAVLESIDAEPCALYRAFERFLRRRDDGQEVNAAVEVGSRRTQVLIGRGTEISFYKPIEIGGRHLNEAVSRKLGITIDEARALRRRLADTAEAEEKSSRDPVRQAVSDAVRSALEELAREVSLCLRYYSVTFRGQRPATLRLMGGEAADAQLRSVLGTLVTVPVDLYNPLRHVDCERMSSADRRGSLSEWTIALGTGMKLLRGPVERQYEPGEGWGSSEPAMPAAEPPARQEAVHA